jgi:hypothetical protein
MRAATLETRTIEVHARTLWYGHNRAPIYVTTDPSSRDSTIHVVLTLILVSLFFDLRIRPDFPKKV